MASGFALFDTAIGWCAIAWSPSGICGVQLPERTPELTRARMRRRFPHAEEADPAPAASAVIAEIRALLRGDPRDLGSVPLDMDGVPPFHQQVYEAARSIPPGRTATYGDIVSAIGAAGSARAVGQALGANPFPIVVPCHRVLGAGKSLGGFSGAGGLRTKLRLLSIEGVAIGDQARLAGLDEPI